MRKATCTERIISSSVAEVPEERTTSQSTARMRLDSMSLSVVPPPLGISNQVPGTACLVSTPERRTAGRM